MLRGVNLGAARRMKMDDLRLVYESLGLRDVRTYVQSGNVVFRASRPVAAARIEDAIKQRFGFHSSVILRTPADLKETIGRNPFPDVEPSRLLVWFLAVDPGEEIRCKVRALETPPEELAVHGREIYIYFPNGMARPKLNMSAIEKTIACPVTGRNWNTVNKLLEIAESL
jgi:uncharacterized protein (DUF1697 family)